MATTNLRQLIDAELSGNMRESFWRKTSSQATTAKVWYDLAVSPGNPSAKLWFDAEPLVAKQISHSEDGGIFHGKNVSPKTKFLRKLYVENPVTTANPLHMILCDYLLYYPSIDDSSVDEQVMTNNVALPRYTDGKGVQMMAVSLASRTGGASFVVNYTNSNGVAGRTSAVTVQNSAGAIGSLLGNQTTTTSTSVPWIGLQSGDDGVHSIEGVTMITQDSGYFAIVLVKPVAKICIRGLDAPVEKDILLDDADLPIIYDDAFLNYICCPQGTLATTTLRGSIKVVWN